MIKDSFEAYVLVNTDLPQTTLVAGYVDKYANRTDTAGSTGKFEQVGDDGAYTIYVKNKSIDNLTVIGQYAQVNNDAGDLKLTYLSGEYKLGSTKLAAQHIGSDDSTDKGSVVGIKASTKIAGLALTAAYNTSDDDADTSYGLGEGTYNAFTKLSVGSGKNAYKADTDSYLVKATYKISDLALTAGYANYDISGTEKDETEFNVKYEINKKLSAKASYTTFGKDEAKSDYEVRTYLTYKF